MAKYLLEDGYKVKELTGGIAAWKEMNFPVSDSSQGINIPDSCDVDSTQLQNKRYWIGVASQDNVMNVVQSGPFVEV